MGDTSKKLRKLTELVSKILESQKNLQQGQEKQSNEILKLREDVGLLLRNNGISVPNGPSSAFAVFSEKSKSFNVGKSISIINPVSIKQEVDTQNEDSIESSGGFMPEEDAVHPIGHPVNTATVEDDDSTTDFENDTSVFTSETQYFKPINAKSEPQQGTSKMTKVVTKQIDKTEHENKRTTFPPFKNKKFEVTKTTSFSKGSYSANSSNSKLSTRKVGKTNDKKDPFPWLKSKQIDKTEVRKIPSPKKSLYSDFSDDDSFDDDDDFVEVKRKAIKFNFKTEKKADKAANGFLFYSDKAKPKKSKYSSKDESSDDDNVAAEMKAMTEKLNKKQSERAAAKRNYYSDDNSSKEEEKEKKSDDSDSDAALNPSKAKKSKVLKESDNDDDDSNSNENIPEPIPSSQGRKNIRAIMSTTEQAKQTRLAQVDEEKRKLRLKEKQKLFNTFQKPDEESPEMIDSLVLDIDKVTGNVLVSVDPEIVRKMKPHQVEGVRFIWDSCFETVEEYNKPGTDGRGCILAHCMGLGKTLQAIAFLHTVMTSDLLDIKTALVVCPKNTVVNWQKEIIMWQRDLPVKVGLHKLYEGKNLKARIEDLQHWKRKKGIGIMNYERFRELLLGKKIGADDQKIINSCIMDPGPDIIVCDEAHIIKNHKAKITSVINNVKTKRRVLLTGTPLQNNLKEYHTMMQFVRPNLLGSLPEFTNRFVNPITNGQHKDSTDYDVRLMKKRAHVLHKMLEGCVQRLDYTVLVPYLPPKFEYVLSIKMTDIQKKLYNHYLKGVLEEDGSIKEYVKRKRLLPDFAFLSRIWSHPYSLTLNYTEPKEPKEPKKPKMNVDDLDMYMLDPEMNEFDDQSNQESMITTNPVFEGTWWTKYFDPPESIDLIEQGNKFIILFEILKTCESIGDKVLVFSQSLKSLNLIEVFLKKLDDQGRKNSKDTIPIFGSTNMASSNDRWRKNVEYFRLDGSTSAEDRQTDCEAFNGKDPRVKLFLISTKAGGMGINLVGANRVVIFDASWNPSQDLQSIFRVFRFGQTKPCYVYRLLAEGTMEEKVYNRQVVKLSLAGRVIDEQQIERHFKYDDVVELYKYDFEKIDDRPTPPVPKDMLLADLLVSHKDILTHYIEHDSLLEHREDEDLTEEERQAAWHEFESEKDVGAKRTLALEAARNLLMNNNTVNNNVLTEVANTMGGGADNTSNFLTAYQMFKAQGAALNGVLPQPEIRFD